MDALRNFRPEPADIVLADWVCPQCGTATPRMCRPGRPRVYCTNACRQKAYRWRRDHGVRLLAGDRQPKRRTHGWQINHLRRPAGDPVGARPNSWGRFVSLCGAFSRPIPASRYIHDRFLFDDAKACRRCLELTGAGLPATPVAHTLAAYWSGPPLLGMRSEVAPSDGSPS